MVLLILWAPVWAKSSRFKRMVAPPMTLDSWGHGVSGVATHIVLQKPIQFRAELLICQPLL